MRQVLISYNRADGSGFVILNTELEEISTPDQVIDLLEEIEKDNDMTNIIPINIQFLPIK